MNVIDKIIVKYLINTSVPGKVFYASLLTLMQKQESTRTPTMGVTISDGQLYLLYNPKFVDLMVEKEGISSLKGVLEHEILHIVHDHLGRCKDFNRIGEIYNLATDMAINQNIDKKLMPKNVWGWDEKGKTTKGTLMFPELFKLPRDKDSEWYYNALMKQSKKMKMGNSSGGQGKSGKNKSGQGKGENGEGQGQWKTIDDHELWKQIKDSKQMVREVVKKAVKEAYENTKKLRGYMPSDLEEKIRSILKPPTLNWRQLLKQYVGASIKTGFKSSWKRPCRRFPDSEEIKGKVSNRTIKILLAIDTSGSVSTKDFQDFMIEMKGILNVYKCTIDVLQCDADLHGVTALYPYSKLQIKFKGRGGTSFLPVFKFCKKHQEYDLLIYFTDGYGDQEECKSIKPVIWVLTHNGMSVKDFKPGSGRIVKIKNKGRNDDE